MGVQLTLQRESDPTVSLDSIVKLFSDCGIETRSEEHGGCAWISFAKHRSQLSCSIHQGGTVSELTLHKHWRDRQSILNVLESTLVQSGWIVTETQKTPIVEEVFYDVLDALFFTVIWMFGGKHKE